MNSSPAPFLIKVAAFLALCLHPACSPPVREQTPPPVGALEAASGVKMREPVDPVGYTHSAEGISRVVDFALKAEAGRIHENRARLGLDDATCFVAALSPHDDYVYAQQVYVHLYPCLKAEHVILIGVAHKAREYPASEGRLVFDEFEAWHGPYGPVPVSPLRGELLRALPGGAVMVSDELHGREHSLEGMIPFLQHFNREASIVPVLVPYMSWDRLEELARSMARALAESMRERDLVLGKDVAILISSDSVHYGDAGWGGRSYADFGTDGAGYDKAVARDLQLITDYLAGEVSLSKAEGFFRSVVAEDFHEYRITWCGRFSIPFGLATLNFLNEALGLPPAHGELLRYGTTLDPGRHDPDVSGLGVTAPANLHHWVGFASMGFVNR